MNQEQETIIKKAECNLLAIAMHDVAAGQQIFHKLEASDFILIRHKVVFKIMRDLIKQDLSTDLETVYQALVKNNQITQAGGLDYLTTINEHFLTITRLDDYLKIIIDGSRARQLQQLVTEVMQSIKEQQSIDQLLNKTEAKLLKISSNYNNKVFVPLVQSLSTVWTNIERLAHTERAISGVGTGIASLDKMTLGFQKGDFIILAGRPSMGKTALAISFMLHAAVRGDRRVAMVSLEMPLGHLIERMLSVEAKVDLIKIKSPAQLSEGEWHKLKLAREQLSQTNILLEADVINLEQIQTQVIDLHRQQPIDLLVVDYLQLVSVRNLKLGSRQAEVALISQTFKQLARRLNIPIICLSQLSRSVERREEKRPLMSDLRDSGAIEQDADIVLFVYRPDYYRPAQAPMDDNQEVELIVSKHRNGPIGSVNLRFSLKYGEFIEVE